MLAHGFTQNSRCWGRLSLDLAVDHELVLVDAPGHGESGHDDADLRRSAALIGDVGGAAVYVGYSMGGRTLLHLALDDPGRVEALVLIGATAGIDDEEERAQRRVADDRLADRLLSVGLDRFLDAWLTGPLFASLDDVAASWAERLLNRPEGLASSLRSIGTGTQEPLWGRLAELSMPVLVLAGADDPKFTALGRRLASAIGDNARFRIVPGGHAVHLESPAETAAVIRSFLDDGLSR